MHYFLWRQKVIQKRGRLAEVCKTARGWQPSEQTQQHKRVCCRKRQQSANSKI